MNHRDRQDLDRHITGNYGEDQFRDEVEAERPTLLDKVNAAIDGAPARLHGVRNAFAQIRAAVELAESERADLISALQGIANHPTATAESARYCANLARAALAKVQA